MSLKPRPSSAATTQINKPLRPLSAYHLFFKLEREYIIQTLSGPDVAGDSVHAEKWRLSDVPRRYGHTRLSPGWYLGPGKGKKRKHRKSHGKISFLELSHTISKRWATLAMTDPETKRYVVGIAAREMRQYKLEMKDYKALTQLQSRGDVTGPYHVTATAGSVISRNNSPHPTSTYHPADVASSTVLPLSMPCLQESMQLLSTEIPESLLSLEHDPAVLKEDNISPHPTSTYHPADVAFSTVLPLSMPCFQESMQLLSTEIPETVLSLEQDPAVLKEEADYSICRVSNNGHYIPSPGPLLNLGKSNMIDGAICDPLFELGEEPLVPYVI